MTSSSKGGFMGFRKAKLFMNNRNQAVRLPKDFEFKGVSEVIIRKEGSSLVLTPARKSWTSYESVEKADDDFLLERSELMEDGRVEL
jgi:antitoxin VapB